MTGATDGPPGPEGWWDDFFVDEHAIFQVALAEVHDSDAETRLVTRLGRVGRDSRVLDVPCGHGRHAVRLAAAGARVTGVDASPAMLEHAERHARERGVDVSWRRSDMRALDLEREFDCVTCLGGSFGYFGPAGDRGFLSAVYRALRPGGRLLLDIPSLSFIRAHHDPRHESRVGGLSVLQERHLDATSGVARIDVTVEHDGRRTSRTYHQQLYLVADVRAMLASSGFDVCEARDAAEYPGSGSNVGHALVLARRPPG